MFYGWARRPLKVNRSLPTDPRCARSHLRRRTCDQKEPCKRYSWDFDEKITGACRGSVRFTLWLDVLSWLTFLHFPSNLSGGSHVLDAWNWLPSGENAAGREEAGPRAHEVRRRHPVRRPRDPVRHDLHRPGELHRRRRDLPVRRLGRLQQGSRVESGEPLPARTVPTTCYLPKGKESRHGEIPSAWPQEGQGCPEGSRSDPPDRHDPRCGPRPAHHQGEEVRVRPRSCWRRPSRQAHHGSSARQGRCSHHEGAHPHRCGVGHDRHQEALLRHQGSRGVRPSALHGRRPGPPFRDPAQVRHRHLLEPGRPRTHNRKCRRLAPRGVKFHTLTSSNCLRLVCALNRAVGPASQSSIRAHLLHAGEPFPFFDLKNIWHNCYFLYKWIYSDGDSLPMSSLVHKEL